MHMDRATHHLVLAASLALVACGDDLQDAMTEGAGGTGSTSGLDSTSTDEPDEQGLHR